MVDLEHNPSSRMPAQQARPSVFEASSVGSSPFPAHRTERLKLPFAGRPAPSTTDRVGLAARLLVARRRCGLSRHDVAKELSVTVAAVGHWENPKGAKPGLWRLNRIAEVLLVDVGWLLSGAPRSDATSAADAAVDRRVGRDRHG